jgi:hypothetical protein
MKTIREIKQFCKTVLGCTVKGNTSSGKGKWQSVYIPSDRLPNNPHILQYSLPPFPEDFRRLCIRTIYPDSPTLHNQNSAGNVNPYSIAMYPHEWETVIETTTWPV